MQVMYVCMYVCMSDGLKTTTTEVDERGSGRLLTLASLNLSCQLGLFEVLNRLGRWSAYGQTLLSGENSGSDQLIVVELIKRRTGQDVCMYVCARRHQQGHRGRHVQH